MQSSHAYFQKNFLSPKMAAILNFRIFCKNCKTQKYLYLENRDFGCQNTKMLISRKPRLWLPDFGCHNSIRLKAEHFLNTLALTFISFSGRFVFAVQKHYLFFFASDPLVFFSFLIKINLCLSVFLFQFENMCTLLNKVYVHVPYMCFNVYFRKKKKFLSQQFIVDKM